MMILLFTKTALTVAFLLFIVLALALDLGVFTKNNPHSIGLKEALWRTIGWVSSGLLFSIVLYFFYADSNGLSDNMSLAIYKDRFNSDFQLHGDFKRTLSAFSGEIVTQYLSGYFVEYSLSVDNLFVMMLIFTSFQVQDKLRKNILFWGVIGAIVMRCLFIFIGGLLIHKFEWILYIFGAILIYSGIKLLVQKDKKDEKIETEKHPVVRFARKILPISEHSGHTRFFTRENGKFMFTGLFVVLLVVEFSDLVFAVDSVPAIFGITRDPYIVFFSNIFAILGLRSLYFLLSHSLEKLHTLKYGLSIILVYIGVKMVSESWFKLIGFTHVHNLMVLVSIILLTILSSYFLPPQKRL
ncbi:MAG: TerC/Alx family metal homeostasis membrane protein [Bacteroidetes bacterium]|nr:TerC/Alx family metal homeostasis membrane protein [Bacteroidota bacterium]